jgi:hypothetical protein
MPGRRNASPEGWFRMQKGIRLARCVRWLYELSLSVYCAYLLILTHTGANIWVVRRLPAPLTRLTRGLFSSAWSFNLQWTAMYLVAAIIFVILRILGQIRPLRTFLCQLAGCAIFLAPLFSGPGADRPGWGPWLWVECAASAVAALLYANRRLPAGVASGAAVVLFHCALWGYVELSDLVRLLPPSPPVRWWEYHILIEGMVLLPLFTSVAWGFYVWLLARPDPTRQIGRRH